jgi:UDP-glucose 4-epimerase
MSILLTGGVGYIGSHIALELLLKHNYKVIIIDNFSNSDFKTAKMLESSGAVVYCQDITDKDGLNDIFKTNFIISVIHLAAYKSVKESQLNPMKYYSNNLNGLTNLLEVMRENNVKNLIFSSSATVYGEPESIPIKEDAKLGYESVYGHTKLICEQILENIHDMKIISLRYFNPVGDIIKADISKTPENLFPYIQQVIDGKLEKLTVFGNDYNTIDGTPVRDYIHILDLVSGHIAALKYLEKCKTRYDVFNVGTGRGYSVLEVIKMFEEKGKSFNYVIGPRRIGDISEIYADTSKIKEVMGWKPKYSLKDAI